MKKIFETQSFAFRFVALQVSNEGEESNRPIQGEDLISNLLDRGLGWAMYNGRWPIQSTGQIKWQLAGSL